MSVTRSKLASRIERQVILENISSQTINYILKIALNEIGKALASGEDVFLEEFGRFYPNYKPAIKIKSGLTGKEHVAKQRVSVKFNAFDKLTTQVQKYLTTLGLDLEEKMLPHLQPEEQKNSKEEPFSTVEREMAKMYQFTHPDYELPDCYGNEAIAGTKYQNNEKKK
jgi:nucleoid DNA-binding protein